MWGFGCVTLQPIRRFGLWIAGTALEHFPEKWSPVFRQKMRPLNQGWSDFRVS
jgi:hypothetical protein